jgi:hypothetical protein
LTTDPASRKSKEGTGRWPGVLGATLLVLLLPLALLGLICNLLMGLLLLVVIWCWWLPRGKSVLFVHSDSPVWRDYLAGHVLGQLDGRAVVLNWSDRSRWRLNLSVLAFWYFGGGRSFNPLGIVFRFCRLPRVFRFYEPFRAFKHGNTEGVEKMTREFLDCALRRQVQSPTSAR